MRSCWHVPRTQLQGVLTFTSQVEAIPHALWDLLSKSLSQQDDGRCRACDVTAVSRSGGVSAQPRKFFMLVITRKRLVMAMRCAWMCHFQRDIHVVVGAKYAVIPLLLARR